MNSDVSIFNIFTFFVIIFLSVVKVSRSFWFSLSVSKKDSNLISLRRQILCELIMSRITYISRSIRIIIYDPNIFHANQASRISATLFTSSSVITGPIGRLSSSSWIFSVMGNDRPFHSL